MASSASKMSSCVICGKVTDTSTCRRCTQDFCADHATEHRQTVDKQMDTVTLDHDQIQKTIVEQTAAPHCHPLMNQIDEWERQSIDKIRQIAEDARRQLLNIVVIHTATVDKALDLLTQQLNKARADDEFTEADLKRWIEQLDRLKTNLNVPATINIQQDDDRVPLVSKILVNGTTNLFERVAGNIHIEENGQVIVRGQPDAFAAVRGGGAYSSGQHRFRFKIEVLNGKGWVFFGITNKDVPMKSNSCNTPTTYGMGGGNDVYRNGAYHRGYKSYQNDMKEGDTVVFLIDCDQHIIYLTNERSHCTHELNVNVTKCPFPWQLVIGLYYAADRIRLLT